MKKFLSDLVASFRVPSLGRVGLVAFGESVDVSFKLNKYMTQSAVQKAIMNISYSATQGAPGPNIGL